MTSDFRPEVEIRPLRACAMKNTQYNPYLWPNCQTFRVFKERVDMGGLWGSDEGTCKIILDVLKTV